MIELPERSRLPETWIKWIYSFYITESDINRYSIGYSYELDRLIIPTKNGYIARSNTEQPKWLQYGTGDRFVSKAVDYIDHIVIVEDALSAIRVGNICKSVALLGTSMSDKLTLALMRAKPDRISIWLDGDKGGKKSAIKLKLKLGGINTKIILTDRDPKCYTNGEIKKILT